ncbi:hypothetical protein [Methanobrevibacter sp.]|uniref:hypothetical protein n=1 Tax=Methanobrevibacter sp. TaxID=66852 RepID=UPI0038644A78
MPINSTYDFDGLFTIDLPRGQNYWNVAWCHSNGALGCKNEYWEKDAGCEINGNEVVIYFYNNSLLSDGESNAWQHAINDLTSSYFYKVDQNDGNLIVLTNDIGMRNMPPYLVSKVNNDGSKVVFVGGHNLDDLKKYADSIEFK